MPLAEFCDTVSVPPLVHDYLRPVVSTEAACSRQGGTPGNKNRNQADFLF